MQVKRGTVIFRHWDNQDGLNEISRGFKSLDELFTLCLQTDGQLLVDRIVIDGHDEYNEPRTVTLVFQSVSVQQEDE